MTKTKEREDGRQRYVTSSRPEGGAAVSTLGKREIASLTSFARNDRGGVVSGAQAYFFEGNFLEGGFVAKAFEAVKNFNAGKFALGIEIGGNPLIKLLGRYGRILKTYIKGIDLAVIGNMHFGSLLNSTNMSLRAGDLAIVGLHYLHHHFGATFKNISLDFAASLRIEETISRAVLFFHSFVIWALILCSSCMNFGSFTANLAHLFRIKSIYNRCVYVDAHKFALPTSIGLSIVGFSNVSKLFVILFPSSKYILRA